MLSVNQLIGFGVGGGTNIQFVGGVSGGTFGQGTGDYELNINGTLTGGIGTTPIEGDFLLAGFAVGSTADRVARIAWTKGGGSPWTIVGSELYVSDTYDTNLRVAYTFFSGSDYTVNFDGPDNVTDAYAAGVLVFRGVNATTPLDVTPTSSTGTNSILAQPPSITPATPGSVIVAVGGGAHNDGSLVTYSSSDLLGFISAAGNDDNDAVIGMGYIPSDSTYTPAQFTYSDLDSTSFSWATITLALRST